MNITIISPHFAPDTAPTGEVVTQIVNELQRLGHRIHVVTALPWYRNHSVEPGWPRRLISREKTTWGKITRIHPFASKNRTNLLARSVAFCAFSCVAALTATFTRRTQIILAMSPPLTLGLAGWIAAKRHKAPLILNVQDIHPDAAIATGTISDTRVIQVLKRIERLSYDKADAVTVLSDDLRKKLISRIDAESKLRVIPNFVDTEHIYPGDRNNSYRHELGLTDETIVMYAGNVGFSQPLELVLEAARHLADRDDIIFVINGNGSRRAYFEEEAEELDPARVAAGKLAPVAAWSVGRWVGVLVVLEVVHRRAVREGRCLSVAKRRKSETSRSETTARRLHRTGRRLHPAFIMTVFGERPAHNITHERTCLYNNDTL